jgi:hypothetical protein
MLADMRHLKAFAQGMLLLRAHVEVVVNTASDARDVDGEEEMGESGGVWTGGRK